MSFSGYLSPKNVGDLCYRWYIELVGQPPPPPPPPPPHKHNTHKNSNKKKTKY